MELGLVLLSPMGTMTMLARATLVVVLLCCLAVPLVHRMRSLQTRRSEPGDSVDLDVLWECYRRGEISWDEYLRGKVEVARGWSGRRLIRHVAPHRMMPHPKFDLARK